MKQLTDKQINAITKNNARAEELLSPYATREAAAVRLFGETPHDPVRSQFAIDADRIINCKFFNRGGDKTQVFSFYKNDDLTRRSSHVQLVSRIARKIGRALRLNLDLIEAIAIGHDIGHTPFGHAGERILGKLYYEHAGKYFNHNVHSVRVLDFITRGNLTVQTLDGIICHCGERVDEKYAPHPLPSRDEFVKMYEACYTDAGAVKRLRSGTLEGCVVRLCDLIAYLGKDRQDALFSAGLNVEFEDSVIGSRNRDIIENVTQDVIANSLDKPYLSLSPDVFEALDKCKTENNEKIYAREEILRSYETVIAPMAERLYETIRCDLMSENTNSIVYKHYLDDPYIHDNYFGTDNEVKFDKTPDDITVDFIASMTDDYFIDAFKHLFPDDPLNDKVRIKGYFN